jgi:hypothetical protein
MIGQVELKWDGAQPAAAICLLLNGQKDPSAGRPVMAGSGSCMFLGYNVGC